MRNLSELETMQVSGGLGASVSGTVTCTTSKTTHVDGSVTESTTCTASTTITVD